MKAIISVPITLIMVYRAWSHASLTPAGIVAAALTASIHALHPWNLPFALLVIFFLAGTRVTKVNHEFKSKLTILESVKSGAGVGRTHIQVFANSGVASVLTLLHTYFLSQNNPTTSPNKCLPWPTDLLTLGIIANYAAVAADTFSSELGILSKSQPRLITSWNLRKVPPGSNGGITLLGIASGFLGSFIISTASIALLPLCHYMHKEAGKEIPTGWSQINKLKFIIAMTMWGTMGSILDSVLGGLLQRTVVDAKSGKVIESVGGLSVDVVAQMKTRPVPESTKPYRKEFAEPEISGPGISIWDSAKALQGKSGQKPEIKEKKLSQAPGRLVTSGSLALLDNNQVNLLMALTMSVGAMLLGRIFGDIPVSI
ncbi:Bgt-1487 [Blumeria graminis f. sp. tritici]|uniref:Bgt-1487 n=2 Tax=Blumeria graminis f. sp. tritici TaxID=62690 RepID=A0A061HN11_BLUGR|nr:Integral membrane protein [Blumeria graminis f. sp. tritici 96224]VCU39991.1 Bgt-1487 [Blumeria graminis f. sp. tritici]